MALGCCYRTMVESVDAPDLLSLLAGAAAFPVAAVSCGRDPAGSSVSQVKSPLRAC